MAIPVVNANTQIYDSFLEISSGSNVTGIARSYSFPNHMLEVRPRTLTFAANPNTVTLNVALQRRSMLFIWTTLRETTMRFSNNNIRTQQMGSHPTGTFRYLYNTGNRTTQLGGIHANPVRMISFR